MLDSFLQGQKRTKVVDLGSLSREELIEVAKKQARQMREKNIRIQEMEQIIDAIGSEPPVDTSPPPRPAAPDSSSIHNTTHNAITTNRSSHVTASSSEVLWEGSEGRDANHHPSQRGPQQPWAATAPADSPISSSRVKDDNNSSNHNNPNAAAAAMAQLQQQLREKESLYSALYDKTEEWKIKVKQITEKDQARIAFLEQQLQTLQRGAPAAPPLEHLFCSPAPPPTSPPTTAAAAPSAPVVPGPTAAEMEAEIHLRAEAAAEAKLEVWRGRFYEKLHEQSDTIDRLQNELLDAQQKCLQLEKKAAAGGDGGVAAPPSASSPQPETQHQQQPQQQEQQEKKAPDDETQQKHKQKVEEAVAEAALLRQQVAVKASEIEELQKCMSRLRQELLAAHHTATSPHPSSDQQPLRQQLQVAEGEIARLQAALAAADATRSNEAAKLTEWQANVKERLGEKEVELSALRAEVQRLQGELTAAAAAASSHPETATTSAEEREEVVAALRADVARLEGALGAAAAKQTETAARAEAAEAEVLQCRAALAAAEEAKRKELADLSALQEAALTPLRARVTELQQQCEVLTAEREELEGTTRALMHFKEMTLRSVRDS